MNPEKRTTKEDTTEKQAGRLKLNDIGFRLILIPAFGIAIPFFTHMINADQITHQQLKLAYIYNIGIAFIIWHGNRYLLFSLRSYFDWFNRPIRKIIALLIAISFFTIPVSSILLVGYYFLFNQGEVNWQIVNVSTLIIMICVLFITHVYETVFLVKDSENEMLKVAQLERSNMEAELRALKNQIDPHFLFNSLNTMSYLIEESPLKAKAFNEQLADVYRYILQNRSRNLVMVQEEMGFLHDYFSLLKIRYENAVELKDEIGPDVMQGYMMPPISMQILVENAFKHNDFGIHDPMEIDIYFKDDTVFVHNKLKRRAHTKEFSKTGLLNLTERYKLITGLSISIIETKTDFTVQLPVLRID